VSEVSIKPWWPGDVRVEKYMKRVRDALERSGKSLADQERIDIYNRSYEAVYEAIRDFDKKANIKNVLVKP